jgi:hypothetical protein
MHTLSDRFGVTEGATSGPQSKLTVEHADMKINVSQLEQVAGSLFASTPATACPKVDLSRCTRNTSGAGGSCPSRPLTPMRIW